MPTALTAIAKIKPGQEDSLRDLLSRSGSDIFTANRLTHFANWVILNDSEHGLRLLWSSNYDGSLETYSKRLIDASPELDTLWAKCQGYPGRDEFTNFIRSHSYRPQVYFVAFPGQTVDNIARHIAIRQAIEEFFDRSDDAGQLDRAHVARLLGSLAKLGTPLRRGWPASVETAPAAVHDRFFGLLLYIARRYGEAIVNHDYMSASSNIDQTLAQAVTDQNQMTNLIDVKPGSLPRLRFVLSFMNFLAKYAFPPGDLAGVRTIHFARWVLIDDGRRMLFQSRFDGSWENYMGDFVDNVDWGLDAIWMNTVGYPTAGMQDIAAFKRFIRDRQFLPISSYDAYPRETVLNFTRDLDIVKTLTGRFSDTSLKHLAELL